MRLLRLCCLFLKTDHSKLFNGDSVTLFILVTLREQKYDEHPPPFSKTFSKPFDMHCEHACMDVLVPAFIKVSQFVYASYMHSNDPRANIPCIHE